MPALFARLLLPDAIAGQTGAIMGCVEVQRRTYGNDARRVNRAVAGVIMPFDVSHIHGLSYARPLIKLPEPVGQAWIIDNAAFIAFEMAVVHRVKTNKSSEKPYVRFS